MEWVEWVECSWVVANAKCKWLKSVESVASCNGVSRYHTQILMPGLESYCWTKRHLRRSLSGHQWPLKPWQPIVLALPALPTATASRIATTTPTDLLLLALVLSFFFCQGSVRKFRQHMMRPSRSARTRRVLRPLADNGWLSSKDSDALAI